MTTISTSEPVAARPIYASLFVQVLAALLLAGVRNVQPRPVGFKFHAVLVVNSAHLASLGAREMPRRSFISHVTRARNQQGPAWHFDPVYWNELLLARPSPPT